MHTHQQRPPMFHATDPRFMPISLLAAFAGTVAHTIAEASGGNSDVSWLSQLGVSAACLVIGWLMLRRSDGRDAQAAQRDAQAIEHERQLLAAALTAAQHRAEHAEKRAERLESWLLERHIVVPEQ